MSRCTHGSQKVPCQGPVGCPAVHWTKCTLTSAPPVFKAGLYILRCRREGPARAILISNGSRMADARCCGYHPGLLRGPWGGREGAIGYTYGTLEHHKAPVMIFHENWPPNIQAPSGARTGPVKMPYGPFTNFTAAGQTSAENSQNVCFHTPYGPRSVYVKAPLGREKLIWFSKRIQNWVRHNQTTN